MDSLAEEAKKVVEKLKSSVVPQAEEAKRLLAKLKMSMVEYVEQVPQCSDPHDKAEPSHDTSFPATR